MKYPIILGGFFILLFSSCHRMKDPVFNDIENVQVSKAGKGRSLMTFNMSYFNPNHTGGRLKEAEGDAWLDSTYLGHFYVDTIVNIPPNSNFIIPVKLDMEMKNIFRHSLAAFLNEQVLITIKGKAKVGKGGFYKKFPLHYEGKQDLAELFK
jgi:LEA14-like dessication related protein